MSPSEEFAWAYCHAYGSNHRSNQDPDCPFCKKEREKR